MGKRAERKERADARRRAYGVKFIEHLHERFVVHKNLIEAEKDTTLLVAKVMEANPQESELIKQAWMDVAHQVKDKLTEAAEKRRASASIE